MARRHVNTTKYEIIRLATKLFLEKGYSSTTPKMICDVLDISTGNLTYYFQTKEHLLAVLVKMLCDFQLNTVHDHVQEGKTSLLAVCIELATMAAMSEDSEIAKDLFLSVYSSPLCLEIIRENDARRAMQVFGEFCPNWKYEQFIEAEILASGIEYATLMTTHDAVSLELRITGAMDNIMRIFNVPEEIRQVKINKVLSMDYHALGRHVLCNFKRYVEETNEHTFEVLLNKKNQTE